MTLLCFEAHAPDGKVWSIQQDGQWLGPFSTVHVECPMVTVYLGREADEPRAFLSAVGPVTVTQVQGVAWMLPC